MANFATPQLFLIFGEAMQPGEERYITTKKLLLSRHAAVHNAVKTQRVFYPYCNKQLHFLNDGKNMCF